MSNATTPSIRLRCCPIAFGFTGRRRPASSRFTATLLMFHRNNRMAVVRHAARLQQALERVTRRRHVIEVLRNLYARRSSR